MVLLHSTPLLPYIFKFTGKEVPRTFSLISDFIAWENVLSEGA